VNDEIMELLRDAALRYQAIRSKYPDCACPGALPAELGSYVVECSCGGIRRADQEPMPGVIH
jgi:hypothetical protein